MPCRELSAVENHRIWPQFARLSASRIRVFSAASDHFAGPGAVATNESKYSENQPKLLLTASGRSRKLQRRRGPPIPGVSVRRWLSIPIGFARCLDLTADCKTDLLRESRGKIAMRTRISPHEFKTNSGGFRPIFEN